MLEIHLQLIDHQSINRLVRFVFISFVVVVHFAAVVVLQFASAHKKSEEWREKKLQLLSNDENSRADRKNIAVLNNYLKD